MAFLLDIKIEQSSGVVNKVNQAYSRIDSYRGNNQNITISLNSYLSQKDYLDGKGTLEPTKEFVFAFDENSAKNIIKQGYEHLKTMSDYADAIDVIED